MRPDDEEVTPARGGALDEKLLRGYRPLRQVSPPDAPWIGTIVRTPDEIAAFLVDDALLGPSWPGWTVASDHVVAPLDVVRRAEGHDALLPLCVERLDALIRRRSREGAMLDDGEIVTIVVSMMRGLLDLGGTASETHGQWWLTDAAKPVFAAIGGSESTAVDACAAVLAQLMEVCGPDVASAIEALDPLLAEHRRLRRDAASVEEGLFAAAHPMPLVTTVLSSRRTRTLTASADRPADREPERRALFDTLVRHVDADLGATVSDTITALWRRWRRAPRRRALVPVAAVAAGAVLTVGLLWPSGDAGPATAEPGSGPAVVPEDSSATADHADESDAPAAASSGLPPVFSDAAPPADPVQAVAALVDGWVGCAGDTGCAGAFVEDLAGVGPPEGAVTEPDRGITLLDELGGVTVLRADSSAAPSQIVVLVQTDGGWLLRDVYDAAQQP